jgi:hypothetical protein
MGCRQGQQAWLGYRRAGARVQHVALTICGRDRWVTQ